MKFLWHLLISILKTYVLFGKMLIEACMADVDALEEQHVYARHGR